MQPSDRSKGPPKMTIGPLPTPPGGSRPPQTPAASKGAPAVGTGILSGSGLNFGPAYVPPRRQPALQGQPVLVTVPKPGARVPPPNAPLPMNGVLKSYAKGAKTPIVWPEEPPARPARPLEPVAAPERPPVPDVVEDPGPAPAWMAATPARAKGANRTLLYVGAAALVVVAIGAIALLTRHPSEQAPAPAPMIAEQSAPAAIAPAAEPLRPQMEVATAEPPPTIMPVPAPKPAAKPRRVQTAQTAAAEPAPRPVAREPVPPPVQVTPQPLAIAPPPAPVQQPAPRIIIPHLDPSAPIATRSPGLD